MQLLLILENFILLSWFCEMSWAPEVERLKRLKVNKSDDGSAEQVLLEPPSTSEDHATSSEESIVLHAEGVAAMGGAVNTPRPPHSHRVEFRFTLDHNRNCFGEEFHDEFRNYTFEYKQVRGDAKVRVLVRDPSNYTIYDKTGLARDVLHFLTVPGDFTFCFEVLSYLSMAKNAYYLRVDEQYPSRRAARALAPGAPNEKSVLCESVADQLGLIRLHQQNYRLAHEDGRQYAEVQNFVAAETRSQKGVTLIGETSSKKFGTFYQMGSTTIDLQVLHERLSYLTALATASLTAVNIAQTVFLKRLFRTSSGLRIKDDRNRNALTKLFT